MSVRMRFLVAGLMVAGLVVAQVGRAQVATDESTSTTESAAKDAPAKCCAEGSGECAKCASGECPMATAMEQLPKMTFKVGKEETCCIGSATQIAKDSKEPIQFVVLDKSFDDQGKAMEALADATDAFVEDFTAPHTCDVSGKTTLAGKEMTCSKTAANIASAMHDAMKTIAISYKVGEKTCDCPNEAKTLAKESGKDTEFVVGTETTHCPMDARIKLAHAKYKAALEAWHKAVASTDASTDASASTSTDETESQGS